MAQDYEDGYIGPLDLYEPEVVDPITYTNFEDTEDYIDPLDLDASEVIKSSTHTNLEKAEKLFKLLLKETPNDPDLYKYLGDIEMKKGEPLEAKKYYEKYIELAPNDYLGYYQLAEITRSEGSHKLSNEYYQKALDIINDQKATSLEPSIEATRARIIAILGNKEESDRLFSKLIEDNPSNTDLLITYIDTLVDTDRHKKAKKETLYYLDQDPKNYKLRRNLIRTSMETYDYKTADREIKSLRKEYPNDVNVMMDRALLYYDRKQWSKAKKLLEKLKKVYPKNQYIDRMLEDIFLNYRPRIIGGLGYIRTGGDDLFGPYLRYIHPINWRWTFETGYTVDINEANIPNIDPNYSSVTNIIDMAMKYKPHWAWTIGAGFEHQLVDDDYSLSPRMFFEYDHPLYGRAFLYYAYNQLLDDPVQSLYFDGKQDSLGFAYENFFFDRLGVFARYNSNWYRVNSAKTPANLGSQFGREDVAGVGFTVDVIKKPRIFVGYDFNYSKLHIKNNYLDIIPLIQESQRHDFLYGIRRDWDQQGHFIEAGGFLGHDPKRNLSLTDLALYGFNVTGRYRVTRRLEFLGHYEYSNESLQGNTGRYHAGFLEALYRF
ncbi:MAG: tetratricopeptide repeat protein [Deltaproteobacteria bacterium]|nr:tetratricopeptide repeat protein [Deltaproteobacteria bacterium]